MENARTGMWFGNAAIINWKVVYSPCGHKIVIARAVGFSTSLSKQRFILRESLVKWFDMLYLTLKPEVYYS